MIHLRKHVNALKKLKNFPIHLLFIQIASVFLYLIYPTKLLHVFADESCVTDPSLCSSIEESETFHPTNQNNVALPTDLNATKYAPFYEVTYIGSDLIRGIFWWLICVLVNIVDGIYGIIKNLNVLNIFLYKPINDFFDQFSGIVAPLFGASIIAYSIMRIVNLNEQKSMYKFIKRIILAGLIVSSSLSIFTFLFDLTSQAFSIVGGDSPACQIVKQNTIDLRYAVSKDEYKNNPQYGQVDRTCNRTDVKYLMNIYINANRTNEFISENKNVDFGIVNGEDGIYSWYKLNDGFKPPLYSGKFGYGAQGVYYYHFDMFTILVMLIITAFALLVMVVKLIRNIFDLGFKKGFLAWIAVTDLSDEAQRTKKIFSSIITGILLPVFMAVVLGVYMATNTLLSSPTHFVFTDPIQNWAFKILFAIGGAMFLIDGPNILVQMLGQDADTGLKQSAMMMGMAGYGALAIGGTAMRGVKNTAGGLAKGISGGVGLGTGWSSAGKLPSLKSMSIARNMSNQLNPAKSSADSGNGSAGITQDTGQNQKSDEENEPRGIKQRAGQYVQNRFNKSGIGQSFHRGHNTGAVIKNAINESRQTRLQKQMDTYEPFSFNSQKVERHKSLPNPFLNKDKGGQS